MSEVRATAAAYRAGGRTTWVRETLLYLATRLGDYLDDMVVVGGLVPSLLIPQSDLPEGAEEHVGTMDVDLGLAIALLNEERYEGLADRLREAGFKPDVNEEGRKTRQHWRIDREGKWATVDFLIEPVEGARGGILQNLERDFAAIITPGLELAFRDRESIQLSGRTLFGENAERSVWCCGPGAFVILKALAFGSRGTNKDAYDLYYILRNYGTGIKDIAARLNPLINTTAAGHALEVLTRDFLKHDSIGPLRVAEFFGGPDDALQADLVGLVTELLRACGQSPT